MVQRNSFSEPKIFKPTNHYLTQMNDKIIISLDNTMAPRDTTKNTCPVCATHIEENDSKTVCPVCKVTFHEECWQDNKGCSTYGCKLVNVMNPPMKVEIPHGASSLKRAELVERLKELARSKPPRNLAGGAMCYSPCMEYITLRVPCPDCKNEALTLSLYPADFDSKRASRRFDKQFYKQFPQSPSAVSRIFMDEYAHDAKAKGIFHNVMKWCFSSRTHEFTAEEFLGKLKEFFVTRIEQNPEHFDALPGNKDISILEAYKKKFAKIQEQGLDADLIVPEHCPRCGYGLRENNFFLEIKYKDRSCSERIELENAFDLELMALFLQGKDRYADDDDEEYPIKDKVDRLRKLFGVEEPQ